MAMVIPKQPRKERDQITIRLDRDVLQTLEHYCRYLDSGRDYSDQPVPCIHLSQGQTIRNVACRPGHRRACGGQRSRSKTQVG